MSNTDNALTAALETAALKGIYVTLAAGNEGVDKMPYPAINAEKSSIFKQYGLNVGAVNSSAQLASWSNYGNDLEVTAPGVNLIAAMPDGYASVSGTSFAAPVLAGTLALALGDPYRLTYKGRLADQLDLTGTNISALNAAYKQDDLGNGLVNAQAFLTSVK